MTKKRLIEFDKFPGCKSVGCFDLDVAGIAGLCIANGGRTIVIAHGMVDKSTYLDFTDEGNARLAYGKLKRIWQGEDEGI